MPPTPTPMPVIMLYCCTQLIINPQTEFNSRYCAAQGLIITWDKLYLRLVPAAVLLLLHFFVAENNMFVVPLLPLAALSMTSSLPAYSWHTILGLFLLQFQFNN